LIRYTGLSERVLGCLGWLLDLEDHPALVAGHVPEPFGAERLAVPATPPFSQAQAADQLTAVPSLLGAA
jgi:hypothetical protein